MMSKPPPAMRSCPMCGGTTISCYPTERKITHTVSCHRCGLRLEGEGREGTIGKWNTRVGDVTQEEINELRRIITNAREALLNNEPFHAFQSLDREAGRFGL